MFLLRSVRVFVYQEPVDMRAGFEKLSFLVREKLKSNITEGNVFLFLGKNRRRMKILYYDGSGLVLLSKRMEKQNFMRIEDLDAREITRRDLRYIMHGSVLRTYLPDSK